MTYAPYAYGSQEQTRRHTIECLNLSPDDMNFKLAVTVLDQILFICFNSGEAWDLAFRNIFNGAKNPSYSFASIQLCQENLNHVKNILRTSDYVFIWGDSTAPGHNKTAEDKTANETITLVSLRRNNQKTEDYKHLLCLGYRSRCANFDDLLALAEQLGLKPSYIDDVEHSISNLHGSFASAPNLNAA